MPRPYPCTQTKRLGQSVRVELTDVHSGVSFSPTDDDTLDASRGADGVPGTGDTGVYGGPLGAAQCSQTESIGRSGDEMRKARRYGPLSISVHPESIGCSGVGERTRTSTGY